jgi:hypothetical protein
VQRDDATADAPTPGALCDDDRSVTPPADEWTVIVETPTEAAATAHEVELLRRALSRNPAARDPAASFDREAETLGAQFQVVAGSREAAAMRGCFAYWGAIAAAGMKLSPESAVLVAPLEDAGDAERFSVVAHLRRG